MACQKVCKQGRDDVIMKVNLQSPIPTSFYIAVTNQCQNGASLIFMRCVVLEIQLFFRLHTGLVTGN